jgi:hypothetical protein
MSQLYNGICSSLLCSVGIFVQLECQLTGERNRSKQMKKIIDVQKNVEMRNNDKDHVAANNVSQTAAISAVDRITVWL